MTMKEKIIEFNLEDKVVQRPVSNDRTLRVYERRKRN